MMKIILILFISVIFMQCLNAKLTYFSTPFKLYKLKFDPHIEDPCGDARKVSSSYIIFDAKVNRVYNSLAIEITGSPFEHHDKKVISTFTMKLAGVCFAGIEMAQKKEIKKIIEKTILGKRIKILSNGSEIRNYCIVEIDGSSLNYSLIRNGLGKYCIHEPYELDWWTKCHYEKVMQDAKDEKLGIWKY